MALSNQQIQQNIDAMHSQGASVDDIKGYIDSLNIPSSSTQPGSTGAPPAPKVPSVGEAIGPALMETGKTVLNSAEGVIGGIANTVMHPIKTAETINNIVQGGIESIGGTNWDSFAKANPDIPSSQIEQMKTQSATAQKTFQNAVQVVKDRYGSLDALGKTITTDPVGFLLDLSVVLDAGGSIVGKIGDISKIEELSKAGNITKQIGEGLNPITAPIKAISKGADMMGLKGAPPTKESTVGRIVQSAKTSDINAASSALGNIDTSNVKTYSDLGTTLQKGIDNNLAKVDAELSKYPETFKPADMTKSFTPESGGKTIKINYVKQSIGDLEAMYKSIKDPESLAKMKDLETKFNKQGLTSKEINDLAKQYGTEFGKKAFGKSGEPLTGTNAQAYENIRSGLKESARGTLPNDVAKALDKQTSEMIKTKDLIDKMVNKVKTVQNKLEQISPLKKGANIIAKGIDIASGNTLSGFFRGLLDFKGAKNLNAVDMQAELQKNLKLLNELDKMPTKDALKKIQALTTSASYAGSIGKTKDKKSIITPTP